jgi:hypothetical protein
MMKKMMEHMIHETLESGGSITQAKGHDQELTGTLIISKGSLGNVFFFHKFSKVLSTAQFIQEIINDKNGKLVFDGEFIEDTKVWTHAPSTFFPEYHDHETRIGVERSRGSNFAQKFKVLGIASNRTRA